MYPSLFPCEKLLNILERLHRIVYEKYSAYEGLEMGLRPDFQPLNDFSGLIYEFGEKEEKHSRHGRIRCTGRLSLLQQRHQSTRSTHNTLRFFFG